MNTAVNKNKTKNKTMTAITIGTTNATTIVMTNATTMDNIGDISKPSRSAGNQTHRLEWRGITIEVRYCPDWSASYRGVYGYPLAHIEIESVIPPRAPLPMTETGYRSHFGAPADMDAERGPVAFVCAWLDRDAQTPAWKAAMEGRRQFALF